MWRTAAVRRRSSTAAVLAGSAALVLGACSTEDIAERAAEEAIEQQLEAEGQGGDVDVDVDGDGGGIRIETPDGSAVIDVDEDGNGNVSIQGEGSSGDVAFDVDGENGETVVSTPDGEMVIGSTEMPDDFPAQVPVPEGLTLVSSTAMDSPDGQLFLLNGTVDGDFGPATEAYAAALLDAGFTQQSMTESTDGTFFSFVSAEWNVSGTIFPGSSGGGADVGINVSPATP